MAGRVVGATTVADDPTGDLPVGKTRAARRSCDCGPSALSAAAGAGISPVALQAGLIGGTTISGLVGGLASVAGGAKFENGAVTAAFGYLFNSVFHSRQAVLFTDDQGNPVPDINGNPMMRPADVTGNFFVEQGLLMAALEGGDAGVGPSYGALFAFNIGGPLDVQRVGPNQIFTSAFTDFANAAIGLYAGAAGFSLNEILTIANDAAFYSHFSPTAVMDPVYTNLRAANVWDIQTGYRLYQSGLVGPSRSQ
jgi:hypothetical protein